MALEAMLRLVMETERVAPMAMVPVAMAQAMETKLLEGQAKPAAQVLTAPAPNRLA